MNKVLMGFCLMVWAAFSQAQTLYPFEHEGQRAQFQHMIQTLRCLVCQNQNLADSNAPLALDLKHRVYEAVIQGQSDERIRDELMDRYGDFILFKPVFKPLTLFLWLAPFAFVAMGLWIFLASIHREKT